MSCGSGKVSLVAASVGLTRGTVILYAMHDCRQSMENINYIYSVGFVGGGVVCNDKVRRLRLRKDW